MKSVLKFIPGLLLCFLMISCESEDDGPAVSTIDVEQVKAVVVSGTWSVVTYEEDGVDETSNFSGYGFSFNADGTINVSNGSTSISGAWSILSDSNSSDDDSNDSDDIDFNIFFTSPANFAEISEDWEIVSYSSTRIELRHVSGGDGSVDRLIFEKQ